jgi:hypothetical protein
MIKRMSDFMKMIEKFNSMLTRKNAFLLQVIFHAAGYAQVILGSYPSMGEVDATSRAGRESNPPFI